MTVEERMCSHGYPGRHGWDENGHRSFCPGPVTTCARCGSTGTGDWCSWCKAPVLVVGEGRVLS